MTFTRTEYRTGYLGRSDKIHVLTLTPPDPFYRSLCSHRWHGKVTTLGYPIETREDRDGELGWIDCIRCYDALSRIEV